jgi:hypothetical protein
MTTSRGDDLDGEGADENGDWIGVLDAVLTKELPPLSTSMSSHEPCK